MTYKRYRDSIQVTPPGERLRLGAYKAFWWALALGTGVAVALGVGMNRTLRAPTLEPPPGEELATAPVRPEPTPETEAADLTVHPPTGTVPPNPYAGTPPPPLEPQPTKKPKEGTSESTPSVYTNEHLAPAGQGAEAATTLPAAPTPRPSPRPSPTPALATPAPVSPEPDDAGPSPDAEASWRERARTRLAAVRSARERRSRIEARVAELRQATSPEVVEDPERHQQLQLELQMELDRLEEAGRELGRAERALARLEEEARQAGVPLEWVRPPS